MSTVEYRSYGLGNSEIPEHVVIGSLSGLPSALATSWMALRRQYVEEHKWKYGDDADEYDRNAATVHVIGVGASQEVLLGIRVTPVESIESSMSWRMISEDMRRDARPLLPPKSDKKVFDLTRLVSQTGENRPSLDELLEVLRVGLHLTGYESGDSMLVYATMPSVHHFIRRNGEDSVILARGKASPGDPRDTLLCCIGA